MPSLSLQRPAPGRYWTVGDVRNTPGRSMFVRLRRAGLGPAPSGIGPTPPRPNMAIFSMSFARAAAFARSSTLPRKHADFLSLPRSEPEGQNQPAGRRVAPLVRRSGASAVRYVATDPWHSCGGLSSRTGDNIIPQAPLRCASIHDAITGQTSTRLPRSGLRWLRASPTRPDDRPASPHLARPGRFRAKRRLRRHDAMGDLLGHAVRFRRAVRR